MTNPLGRLAGKRVLVTSAGTFMGPPVVDLFAREGAEVVADDGALLGPDEPAELIGRVGELDVLVANLDLPAYGAPTVDITDEGWLAGFECDGPPVDASGAGGDTGHDRPGVGVHRGSHVVVASASDVAAVHLLRGRDKERLAREVPSRRIGQPEETAELALFLAGDTSSFIFGQIISNDGGWS